MHDQYILFLPPIFWTNDFRDNFESGVEPDGAAFTVYHQGEVVIDLWGGYADKEAERPWKKDTMTLAFSSSKGIGALVVAYLVER